MEYYTPEIEDIRVGYECEICPSLGYNDKWIKVVGRCEEVVGNGVKSCNLDELTYDCLVDGHVGIRTPYLTKEQIEAEGWTNHYHHNMVLMDGTPISLYDKGSFNLIHDDTSHTIYIQKNYRSEDRLQIFEGKCPSINEFRIICKLLGI